MFIVEILMGSPKRRQLLLRRWPPIAIRTVLEMWAGREARMATQGE